MNPGADVTVVARRLRSSPGYTLGIVATLALALGANTSIFGVVHSTLLNPLAVRDPSRLVVVWESDPAKSVAVVELAYNTFRDWAAHSRSFSQTGAFGSSTWTQVLIVTIVGLASYLPARRAAAVDPLELLKAE